MAATDKRIIELPLLELISGGMYFPIYDPGTDVTYRVKVSTVLPSEEEVDYTWNPNIEYDIDQIVSRSAGEGLPPQLYISTAAANLGNPPEDEGSLFWTLAVRVTASGVKYYSAGVYTETEAFVAYTLDSKDQLFRLDSSVARPFNSTNLITEFAQGKWTLVGERGYLPVTKAAHGFAVGDWLTIKAGAWAHCDLADIGLGRICNVIDANTFIVALKTNLISVTGLVAFTTYYHTAAGQLTTVENDNPALIALSATEAIIYPGAGGSGSGGGGAAVWGGITGLITDQADLVTYVDDEITAAVVGLFDDRGNYDPTATSTYPASGGSGAAGAILKGDIWRISVNGTIDGMTVRVGDTVRALVDTPGSTAANWALLRIADPNKFDVVTANISGAVNIDLSTGTYFILTLTADVTSFGFSNEEVGKQYLFKFKKDTTEKAFTWAAGKYRFPFGTAPSLTDPTTNGTVGVTSEDIVTAICSNAGRLDVVITPDLIEN